jgi:hypothetical protein
VDGLGVDSGLGGVALHLHAPKAAARASAAAKIPNHSRLSSSTTLGLVAH